MSTMTDTNRTSNLRLSGVGRAADDGEPLSRRVIELHFDREPTDAEMRAVHEYMREFSSAVETQPAASKGRCEHWAACPTPAICKPIINGPCGLRAPVETVDERLVDEYSRGWHDGFSTAES